MKSYAVVFSYSFDEDVAVYLFDSADDAKKYLRESLLEEYRIDTEENGWDSSYFISESGLYGRIENRFKDQTDITEFQVGFVYHNI